MESEKSKKAKKQKSKQPKSQKLKIKAIRNSIERWKIFDGCDRYTSSFMKNDFGLNFMSKRLVVEEGGSR